MASPSMPKSPLYDGCPSNVSWNRVTHFQSSSPWPSSSSTFEKRPVDKVGLTGTGQDDEAMSETDEEEWEFEETEDLVMLDVGGKSARLAHMSHDYNITVRVLLSLIFLLIRDQYCGLKRKDLMIFRQGLESDHPFFKLGNLTFKGRWDQLLGTELLLHLDRGESHCLVRDPHSPEYLTPQLFKRPQPSKRSTNSSHAHELHFALVFSFSTPNIFAITATIIVVVIPSYRARHNCQTHRPGASQQSLGARSGALASAADLVYRKCNRNQRCRGLCTFHSSRRSEARRWGFGNKSTSSSCVVQEPSLVEGRRMGAQG